MGLVRHPKRVETTTLKEREGSEVSEETCRQLAEGTTSTGALLHGGPGSIAKCQHGDRNKRHREKREGVELYQECETP